MPLRPDTARNLYKIYLAKGSLGTTAIEGNTLSEEEVLKHIEGKLHLPESRRYLAREVDNIIAGCNTLLEKIKDGKMPAITPSTISHMNKTILEGLDLEEDVIPGELRKHSVVVGRYRGAPAEDLPYLMEHLCQWLSGEDFRPTHDLRIVYALLKAVIAHLYLAWIHPFGDGNGRTARMLEFQVLISAGVPAVSAHLFSNHYNLTRQSYYRQLEKSSKSEGDILPFIEYAVQGFLDGLREQIQFVINQQRDIIWRNFVHEYFRDKTSRSHIRRKHLILDLSRQPNPVPALKIPEISPRLAVAYSKCTRKTLIRDLNSMCREGLIVKTENGYRVKREILLGFFPLRARDENDRN